MTYIRGNGSTDVELARAQSWIEVADPILFGDEKDSGMVKEHQDDRAAKHQQDKYVRNVIGAVALFGTVVPLLIKIAELLHWIPK